MKYLSLIPLKSFVSPYLHAVGKVHLWNQSGKTNNYKNKSTVSPLYPQVLDLQIQPTEGRKRPRKKNCYAVGDM